MPKVLKLKEIAKQLSRALGDDHFIWFRDALQARGEVRCLADNCLLLRSAGADQIANYNQTGCDADPRLEGPVGLQSTYSRDQLQPCAHGSLSVVFV